MSFHSNVNDQIQNRFADSLDRCLSTNHGSGVDIDDVCHAFGETRVGGNFNYRGDGIAGGRTQAGGKENDISARTNLSGYALDVIAWSAKQRQARRVVIFRIVQNFTDGRSATLPGCAGGLHRVGDQPVLDISRGRIDLNPEWTALARAA